MPDFTHSAHASVVIERPARYGKQLSEHLGHKIPVEYLGDHWVLTMGSGLATVTPTENTLELSAEAHDSETLDRVKDVLGRHLLKFAHKLDITLDWIG